MWSGREVTSMEAFGSFVTQHMPLVWPLLGILLVLILALAIAAVPAYFVFYPIANTLRRAIHSYLARLVVRHDHARAARSGSYASALDEFRSSPDISYMPEGATSLEHGVVSLARTVEAVGHRLDAMATLRQT